MEKQYNTQTNHLLLCLLFIFSSVQGVNAQELTKQGKIDSLMTHIHTSGNFNGIVLVMKGENTIHEKSYGYRNALEKEPLRTSDQFSIGSIYKELPAIAIMQLQEKGLLAVKDKISAYILDLPEWSNNITIENLLQYTSGLPKIQWGKNEFVSDENLMNDLKELKELQFNPGEGYLYSNNNPFLLAQIIQNISKTSYATYVQDHILKPIGLTQSTFKSEFPYKDRKGMAIPFNDQFEEDTMPFKIKSTIFLYTTSAYDLFKLNYELHQLNLINEASLKTISESTSLSFENIQSPLGNVEILNNKIVKHSHHGSSGNFECLIRKDVSNDLTIILFTNRKRKNVHEISDKIMKIVL